MPLGSRHRDNEGKTSQEWTEMRSKLLATTLSGSPNSISAAASMLDHFVNEIELGDVIVTPLPVGLSGSGNYQLMFGVVTGDYELSEDPIAHPDGGQLPHTRSVEWEDIVPKAVLSEAAQRGLQPPRTLFRPKAQDELLGYSEAGKQP